MSEPFSPVSVRFGDFELIPQLRRLERDGEPVDLSSRATDILCLLAERPGQIVTKRELLERVWPDMVVDEGSIRFHIAALRRVLGDGEAGVRLIATVPGRGYCFVGSEEGTSSHLAHAPPPNGLPAPPGLVVGREGVVEDLVDRLDQQQFVTVVGAAGLGKTTVALLVAHHWSEARREPVTYIDLGAVTTDALDAVADAVAAALGLAGQAGNRMSRVVDYLRQQRHLLVLDTCEATIEGAARFAEAVFAAAPEVRVLAASREALRIEGEWVYRLEALAPPGEADGLSAADAMRFPAVQLFVQRAAANQAGFALHDEDAPLVSAICRDLGGMALALELAAGRVEAYGVRQVAGLLQTRFALTWPGRRTAPPRHQTLLATLEWSHDLLSPLERIVFRRLSVFVGAFTLDRAVTLLSPELLPDVTVATLSSLVGRSLIHIETGQTLIRYRLLDTTRAFAEMKLADADEEQPLRRAHALLYQAELAQDRDAAPPHLA
jgi:predicted ATPase/DNA-binding winged helix-turn-helix (wHTH) protein